MFFVQEPEKAKESPYLQIEKAPEKDGVSLVTPYVVGTDVEAHGEQQSILLKRLFAEQGIHQPILWYYTPMALRFSRHLPAGLIVYDMMDDLSAFMYSPSGYAALEEELFQAAGLVFTGGVSMYEARRGRNSNMHPFPSSVDAAHFRRARRAQPEPEDQKAIPHPRLGYFGVIDERMDLRLLEDLAASRPDWHLVLLGPVAKIDPGSLPKADNIHYLGKKSYAELPVYLAGWDVALIPFANNQATKVISPTKTPEYLAGGKPVISTAIQDVIRPYGDEGLVWIAPTASKYILAVEAALEMNGSKKAWLKRVDRFLEGTSWDRTWEAMNTLMLSALQNRAGKKPDRLEADSTTDLSLEEAPPSEESISMPAGVSMPVILKARTGSPRRRSSGVYDYMIVGAGFAGSVLAERLARGSGKKVLLVDRRPHIAGNAYDLYNDDGLLIHKYGPHIFHTNSKEVFVYLSQFTLWRPYEHRVRVSVDGQILPMPINLDTINRLYGLDLSYKDMDDFFKSVAEPVEKVRTSEDVVVSKIGRELYEKFFRNYTRKQWGLDPSELDAQVTSRVPIRSNRDDRYFTDTYQSMPLYGYTRMFENMLDHPNIHIMLNTEYEEVVDYISCREMIFTGPVDEYFNYRYGKLPYRSLQFQHVTLDEEFHQETAVTNYPNEHAYTRVTEFKHLTGQKHPRTSLVYEYPCSEGDPYYPIPRPENADLYARYKALADQEEGVYFAGRLATYRYYNMDQVTAQALTLYAKIAGMKRSEALAAYTTGSFSIQIPCTLLSPQGLDS